MSLRFTRRVRILPGLALVPPEPVLPRCMVLAAVLRCRDVKAFAAICLLGVGATCAAAAEPFPTFGTES